MVKYRIGLKFDKHFLNTLKENSKSGVELQRVKHHLALHPIHLNDFNKSIKDLLNQGIAKYNKNLDGLLLGYQNIKLCKDIGLINNDSCCIHIDLEADFFVFKPEIGKEMQGMVTRKSKDHVGVLVYDAFNVSIPRVEMDDDWLGSSVNIGCEVLFSITYINLASYLPYIKGELISIISEVDTAISPKKKKLKGSEKLTNKKTTFVDESSIDETPNINDSNKRKRDKNDLPEQMRNSKKKKVDPSEEQSTTKLHGSKKKKKKVANKLEEIDEGFKKKKTKLKKKIDEDQVSHDHLNISELFEETEPSNRTISLGNIKSRLGSDVESDKTSANIENSISTKKVKKSKKKKKQKEEESEETFVGDLNTSELFDTLPFENIKSERFDSELEITKNDHKIKKSKKRKQSFSELEFPTKKHKRKSN